MEPEDILQRSHAWTVLLTVYKNKDEGIIQKDLADKQETGSNAKQIRINEQIEAGLLKVVNVSEGRRKTKRYYVTEEGERIAKLLNQIRSGDELMNYGTSPEQGNILRG